LPSSEFVDSSKINIDGFLYSALAVIEFEEKVSKKLIIKKNSSHQKKFWIRFSKYLKKSSILLDFQFRNDKRQIGEKFLKKNKYLLK